ncbi:polyprenyl synthetase [Enterococcus canis]|uniref:Polyprenyl synthetase n=1 Tax=Enterococcus canis TaxID=214095 RepID=A0A1L8RDG2_9ENTE|nr:polyprenyl synthetase family protein [Enterococcus canis]OJG17806.1 polyprenyl synthetase [Enterococcus canis]
MKLHEMWQGYPQVADELAQTLRLMEKSIQLKNKQVEQAIMEMIHSGGKLLRPAYQLLFAQFGPDRDSQKAVSMAASIEMLHTATLIHDDIVDDADLRRGLPTIRSSFGNDAAVYAGDYLFVCCFKLLADYASSMRSLQLNSRSMEKILGGELGQMDNRYKINGTIDDYLDNISGKTAELFSMSCSIGAYESGCSELFSNNAGKIGRKIGLAFQIIDDILDYTQPADMIGKPVLEDVRQGVYSLPLLYALKTNRAAFIPYLEKRENMTDADTQKVYELVHQYDGVTQAQALAAKYTNEAIRAIQKLPQNEADTRGQLERLTRTILDRQN